MKGREILLDHVAGLQAAALMVDGMLDDLLVDAPDLPRPGAIYRAICDRPMKGQGGMMLRLPDGMAGFLRQTKGLSPGQALLVQVTGYADHGKAVPLTDRVLFKSRYAIVTPGRPGTNVSRQITNDETRDQLRGIANAVGDLPHGLILRSSCAAADADEIIEDIDAMIALADAVAQDEAGREPEALTEGATPHELAWREWTEPATVQTQPGCFETLGALDQIAALADPTVTLGEGAMHIEPARALVAVDVDTGAATSPAAALKANLAASRALPRALRLRGFGGQVVVDFVSVSKAHRKQIEQTLRAAFRADPIETSLVGWTQMGLFELQRKRERQPLSRRFLREIA